ncbi:thiamine pyrophosphate-dependent enzyme [Paratissierella segnis]|uniref:2-oxoglutarate oxidoreductase n=1 Tax=Paratissierella segnis TaxID=2763679 RepID=A0A926IKD1_9FIRM|nr:thiamine pyrophosphate-dependent enzyme [Paratissierella segnis]MBC8588944.1 2-oxoglutarate oxidoreductase [Paratissierella segnis]
MKTLYTKPLSLRENGHKYCPGCMHGIANRIIGEAVDELAIRREMVGVIAVGCANLSQLYFNFDLIGAAHGRAAAVATGYKRMAKDRVVMCYQGDGDLASIGIAETLHAANRGENITVIFINNCIYGMTGGQMAPTTLIGQKSTTTIYGRNASTEGYPIRMAELISQLEAPAYVARFALNSPRNINDAKKGIKKAFTNQINNKGYSFVELLSNCPTNWKMNPKDTLDHVSNVTSKYFPLGVYRDKTEVEE